MALQPATREFLTFLQKHREIRKQIRAAPGQTLLYAGGFFKPMWREIEEFKRRDPQLARKEILPEVLARLSAPGTRYSNLREYVEAVEKQVPWQPDGFTLWRALSGIYASNAVGAVSFQIGSGVSDQKVFAATEAAVLARNPKVDATTKDLLAYFQRCIGRGEIDINVGFLSS
jgi:hypothetical protein